MNYRVSRVAVATALLCFFSASALAECRKVGSVDTVKIAKASLSNLATVGINREVIFEAIKDVSMPETSGCWAGASGNFDGQIVSLGTLQWNYGQKSLQPLMRRFRAGFPTTAGFNAELTRLMPNHGRLIFSTGCLREEGITAECRDEILKQQQAGKLTESLKGELDALFESDRMIQIQMDVFVKLLESVRDDLRRVFAGRTLSARQIKWAIDTKVQQGGFPGTDDITRMRTRLTALSEQEKRQTMLGLVDWYHGLSRSIDQGGIRLDWRCNVEGWRKKMNASVTDEQAELLHLSFLKSRTAQGMSGHWQALTFQRRAKIILGVGSVGGDRVGIPRDAECLRAGA